MPGVTRLGDTCTGHGAFPPRANVSASGNVFVNGKGAHRVGDGWATHCDPSPVCHSSTLAGGSGSVFVNGKALGRIGDSVGCGSAVASGSGNVFAGG
jgi:uncharacterized Zn-binding protein involved in type VI secretion